MWYKIRDREPIKTMLHQKRFSFGIVFLGMKGAYTNYVYQRYGDRLRHSKYIGVYA